MRSITRYRILDVDGALVALHARQELPDGDKRMWWEQPDGRPGLPDGVGVVDLPLFGSELVADIPITESIVITEGERDALALRAGGIPALATVTGASTAPTPRSLHRIALGARFIFWPDNDEAGLKHAKSVAQNLFTAGALGVRILRYAPLADRAVWPKGAGAADVVAPETARILLGWLLEDWSEMVRRSPRRKAKSAPRTARSSGSVTAALLETFGIANARPGKSVKCPMHDDRSPSLWICPDDQRAICFAACDWARPGVTARDIGIAARQQVVR